MLERSSLPDQVFRELAGDVVSGRYAPGDRLPSQRALAADLGVNMASLREGIKRLEQLRLVDVRHGNAMRVNDWRLHAGLDVLVHGGPQVIAPLFEARRILLSSAAGLAAARRSDEQARTLGDLAEAFAATREAQAVDLAFMATLIEASHNLVFTLILNSIRELYAENLEAFAAIVADQKALAPLYREAAQAVAAHRAGAAEAAMDRLAGAQERAMLA